MRFSTLGGRAGIYARVNSTKIERAFSPGETEAAFMRWLLIMPREFLSTPRFVQWLLQQFLVFENSIQVIRSHSRSFAAGFQYRVPPAAGILR